MAALLTKKYNVRGIRIILIVKNVICGFQCDREKLNKLKVFRDWLSTHERSFVYFLKIGKIKTIFAKKRIW